jgi:hypothetical protein
MRQVPIYGDVTVPDPLQSDSMQWLAGELGAYRKRESTRAMAGRDTRKTTVRGRKTAIARSRKPDGHTRQALYARAKRRQIEGRSKMSKRQLENALGMR